MKQMFYILAAEIAQESGGKEAACRGLLRLAIEDVSGVRGFRSLDTFISNMGFREWERVLDQPALLRSLTKIGVNDAAGVIARTKKVLVENQSLFTMSVRY